MSEVKCEHIIREEHTVHKDHEHEHGPDCGHTAIVHQDAHGCEHIDYVHDGHLHHKCENGENHYHDCSLEDFGSFPDGLETDCKDDFQNACHDHDDGICGTAADCTHEAVPHGDHTDYIVDDNDDEVEVHCPHNGHCDIRGYVKKAPKP